MKIEQINKTELQNLGLNLLKNYFLVDPKKIKDKEVLIHLLQKAKLGIQLEKEMNLSKRAEQLMTFRIVKLTSKDKDEMIKYLKDKMPEYL